MALAQDLVAKPSTGTTMRASSSRHADLEPTLLQAQQRLSDELRRLGLPTPCLVLHSVEPGLGVLSLRVATADQAVNMFIPVNTDEVMPAELACRMELPAPASAVLGRDGWNPHPDQHDDPFARAFCDRLGEAAGLQNHLSLAPALDGGEDWLMQIVADAADSSLLVVRTAAVGPRGDQLGLSVFLDLLPRVRHLVRSWDRPFALPIGAARDCLAVQDQPVGESWEPDWRQEEGFVLIPDPIVDEEEEDTPTELDDYRPLVNLAGLALLETEEEVLREQPELEIIDPVDEEDEGDEPTIAEPTPSWAILDEPEEAEAPTQVEDPPTQVEDPPAPTGSATTGSATTVERVYRPSPPAPPRPSPGRMALASLVFPGLGQILCGERRRGGLILLVSFFTLGLFGILNVYAAWDAWKLAQK